MSAPLGRLKGLGSLHLEQATAEQTACGEGDTYCKLGINADFQTVPSMDRCAIQASAALDESVSNYVMWVPKYRQSQCEASGYVECGGPDGNRVGPRQILQESVLQGRGQVLGPKGCPGSQIKYLPEGDIFRKEAPARKCHDMSLGQQTRTKRSCGSVTEVDLSTRYQSLPQTFQGSYAPLTLSMGASPAPTINGRTTPVNTPSGGQRTYGSSRRKTEGHTLENKRYPTFAQLKEEQDSQLRE